jgi:hypothetical protein
VHALAAKGQRRTEVSWLNYTTITFISLHLPSSPFISLHRHMCMQVSWLNYTTITFTDELCLEIIARDDVPGGMPRVQFSVMRRLCQ